MATFLAHFTVKPGNEEWMERQARALYEATHANEPRMRRYEWWRGQQERTYHVLESFDDYHGFLEHQSSSHHDDLMEGFRDRVESFWIEWLDPVQGAAPLVVTTPQEAPVDASDAVHGIVERMPVEVAAWWLPLR